MGLEPFVSGAQILPEARPCAPYSQRALSGRRAAAGTRRSGEF